MIAVKLKKLWKPTEIFQKCSLCFDQSQKRSEHARQPQNYKLYYDCCLRFGFLTLDWLFRYNTITFQKLIFLVFTVFRVLQYSLKGSVSNFKYTVPLLSLQACYVEFSHSSQLTNSMLAWNFYSAHTYILYTKQRKSRITPWGHHQMFCLTKLITKLFLTDRTFPH